MMKTQAQGATLFEAEKPAEAAKPKPKQKAEPKPAPAKAAKAEAAKPAIPKKPSTAVAVRAEPQSVLTMIAAASRDKEVDLAKMKELLAMQREIFEMQAAARFSDSMLAAQSEMPRVVKNRWNNHTKSRWADLEKVSREIDPIARKHGFTFSYGMSDSPIDDHYRIICDVSHRAPGFEFGQTRRYFADYPSDAVGAKGGGTKSPAQGVSSTITIARRYLKLMVFDITPVGEDDDGEAAMAGLPIDENQLKELTARIEDGGPDKIKFCKAFQIEGLALLPKKRFREALDRIDDFKAKRQ